MQSSRVIVIALCLTSTTNMRSFVDSAPLSEGPSEPCSKCAIFQGVNFKKAHMEHQQHSSNLTEDVKAEHHRAIRDTSEQELENLKALGQLGKTLDLIKERSSIYANINGEKQAQSVAKEEVKSNGETLAKVSQQTETNYNKEEVPQTNIKTELEVPSEGIHRTILQMQPDFETVQKHIDRRSPLSLNLLATNEVAKDKTEDSSSTEHRGIQYTPSGGIQYSPLDVAEYVFWTGDERGVTLAIEEFLQEGLMTREEAISFLQEIKYNLDNLKNHYTQLGLNSLMQQRPKNVLQKQDEFSGKSQEVSYEKPQLRSNFDIKQLRQGADRKRAVDVPSFEKVDPDENLDEDYDHLLERLRIADFLYTEYSLEEVIYQLAKLIFTQSLTHGTAEAQQALQKFTNFLEAEAAQGHISRSLEKKVLDVLIASLTDTLSEHPELLAAAKENLEPTSTNTENHSFVKQILNSNLDGKTAADYYSFTDQNKNDQFPNSLSKNAVRHVPFDMSKYKNS